MSGVIVLLWRTCWLYLKRLIDKSWWEWESLFRRHCFRVLTPRNRIYPLSFRFGKDCDEISVLSGVQSHKVVFHVQILLFLLIWQGQFLGTVRAEPSRPTCWYRKNCRWYSFKSSKNPELPEYILKIWQLLRTPWWGPWWSWWSAAAPPWSQSICPLPCAPLTSSSPSTQSPELISKSTKNIIKFT